MEKDFTKAIHSQRCWAIFIKKKGRKKTFRATGGLDGTYLYTVVPATPEVEVRGPALGKSMKPYLKQTEVRKAESVAHMTEYLPSNPEALNSNTPHKK
jgi:hypothetical protein